MIFRNTCLFILAVLLSPAGHAHYPNDFEWELRKDKHGIEVYKESEQKRETQRFLGRSTIKVSDPYSLAAVLNDYEAMPRWLHYVGKVTELERKSDLERVLHVETFAPWPIADRDMVMKIKVEQDFDTNVIRVDMNNVKSSLEPAAGFVRFKEFDGSFTFEWIGDGKILVSYEVSVNPGGVLPAFLVNILTSDAPYFTLLKFQRVIEKDEYQGMAFDYLKVPDDWNG